LLTDKQADEQTTMKTELPWRR